MPSKKKKYNARFPAGRIKKIMQSDEEIGKVAQAVPVIISRTLELFVESLLTKTLRITNSRNARTLSTSHMKQCIMSEQRFDFLRELVKNIPDISVAEEAANYNEDEAHSSPEEQYPDSDTPFDLSMPSTSNKACRIPCNNGDEQQRSVSPNSNSYVCRLDEQNRSQLKRQISGQQINQSKTRTINSNPSVIRSDSTTTTQNQSNLLHIENSKQKLKQYLQTTPQETCTLSASSSTSNHHTSKQSQQKQEDLPNQPKQTAIPSPIVSFDFCNKPVVKIDYSNIAMSTINSDASFNDPSHVSNKNGERKSAFDFNAEPIINIDLSNMIQPSTFNTALVLPATSSTTSLHKTQKDVLMAVPLNPSNSVNKTSCFELDEDYDNI